MPSRPALTAQAGRLSLVPTWAPAECLHVTASHPRRGLHSSMLQGISTDSPEWWPECCRLSWTVRLHCRRHDEASRKRTKGILPVHHIQTGLGIEVALHPASRQHVHPLGCPCMLSKTQLEGVLNVSQSRVLSEHSQLMVQPQQLPSYVVSRAITFCSSIPWSQEGFDMLLTLLLGRLKCTLDFHHWAASARLQCHFCSKGAETRQLQKAPHRLLCICDCSMCQVLLPPPQMAGGPIINMAGGPLINMAGGPLINMAGGPLIKAGGPCSGEVGMQVSPGARGRASRAQRGRVM
jgi:hypothetical protein